MALEVKLEEDKSLLLLSYFPSTYNHLATTTMYGKETLKLKDIRQMLKNNKLMKKIYYTEEVSGLVIKGQRVRSQSRRPKRDREASNNFFATFVRNQGTSKKNCMKYKEILKKKGCKDSDKASGKADQTEILEQADEDPCDVLTAQSGKGKYAVAWLLDSERTYHICPKKEWFSSYKLYDGSSVLMGNDAVCKAICINNIRMRMF